MRLRKKGRRIYLGIYNISLMNTADIAFDVFSSGWDQIDKPFKEVHGNRFFGLRNVMIESDGEAYIELSDFHPNVGFYNVGLDFIKSLFNTMKLFYEGFEYFDLSKKSKEERPYEGTNEAVSQYASILNVWNDTYTDDDVKLLGMPFDPFKQGEFEHCWKIYNRLINRTYAEATKTMPNEKFNELKETYTKMAEFFNAGDQHFSYINRSFEDNFE